MGYLNRMGFFDHLAVAIESRRTAASIISLHPTGNRITTS